MKPIIFVLSVLASWVASVLAFPIIPFQYWLNSRIKKFWRFVTFQKHGFTGQWLAEFGLNSNGHLEHRQELVSVDHLSGDELRGKIKDKDSSKTYRFLARVVFDEIVGHYWSIDESRDIGTFKLTKGHDGRILSGPLIVYNTQTKKTMPEIDYTWHYLPPWIVRWLKPVRRGRSLIHRIGFFANRKFASNDVIGNLKLGNAAPQGEHTILFNGEHRLVKKPWRHLNHSCTPNAELSHGKDQITLKATEDILPQMEVTIDYEITESMIAKDFDCNCQKQDCREHIGKSKGVRQ